MKSDNKEIIIILENIRSSENVGSIFRSADAFGVSGIYLVGITPQLLDRFGRPNNKIKKTALGGEETVPSKYFKTIEKAINEAKKNGFETISLELSKDAKPIKEVETGGKIALILGNEVSGVSKEALSSSDKIVEIPIQGKKESLNVAVAAGIAMFWFQN